jgi:hypothetical protein
LLRAARNKDSSFSTIARPRVILPIRKKIDKVWGTVHLYGYSISLLKKGTGSEPIGEKPAKNDGCEVPVPLFQRAAMGKISPQGGRDGRAVPILGNGLLTSMVVQLTKMQGCVIFSPILAMVRGLP